MTAPWMPLDVAAWPEIVETLPMLTGTGAWPEWAVVADLRWHVDQRVPLPGRPALAIRWRWSDRDARTMLANEARWWDPTKDRAATNVVRVGRVESGRMRHVQQPPATASNGPAPASNGTDERQESRGNVQQPPAPVQQPPAPVHARDVVHRTPTPTPTPVGQNNRVASGSRLLDDEPADRQTAPIASETPLEPAPDPIGTPPAGVEQQPDPPPKPAKKPRKPPIDDLPPDVIAALEAVKFRPLTAARRAIRARMADGADLSAIVDVAWWALNGQSSPAPFNREKSNHTGDTPWIPRNFDRYLEIARAERAAPSPTAIGPPTNHGTGPPTPSNPWSQDNLAALARQFAAEEMENECRQK